MLKFLRSSASRYLVFVPALLGFLVTSSSAEADSFGVWEFSKSCLASQGGSVVPVEGGFTLTGADGGTCAGQSHWVKMQAIVPEGTNQIGFLWTYQTYDGAWYDPPQIILNGVITQLTNQSNATGSGLVQVQAGDIFAFQQYSTDSCCQPGNLTITGLTLGLGEWVSTTSSTTATTTSTTTVPSTTVPVTNPTTTTLQTVVPSTTTEPPQTTTTVQETVSPDTSTSSTTTTTSTTVAPTTTTTVYVPPATTTTVPETTTTTTTTEPVPAPTTTLPPPLETTSTTSTTTTTLPPVTTTQPDVTTTLQTPTDEPQPLTQTELLNTLEALSEAPTEAIEAIVDEVLTKDLDTSQATLLIATPAVLANITTTQAEQLFNEITPTELSPDEAEAVVEAVQSAPSSIRKAFESVLNIFQGFADSYVPLNSTVPVKTRRALIALGAVFLTVAPAPVRRIR